MNIDFFKVIVRNIVRNKLRTFITILSIAIGACSIVIITAIGQTGKAIINTELTSLGADGIMIGLNKKNSLVPMKDKQLDIVKSQNGVTDATPIIIKYTDIKLRGYVAKSVAWGIDKNAKNIVSLNTVYGRNINSHDVDVSANVCVVDESVARLFYKRDNIVNKNIYLMFNGSYHKFTVVGVAQTGGNVMQGLMNGFIPSFVYIPCTTMARITGQEDYDKFAVSVNSSYNNEQVGNRISEILSKESGVQNSYTSQNLSAQKEQLDDILNIVTFILTLIAGISLIVAGLGITTIMLVTISERTREIGIKKALGATNISILLEFTIETFTVSFIGSIIGIILAVLMFFIGCMLLNIEMIISIKSVFSTLLFSVGISIIFSAFPAYKASKLDPVKALRTE